MNDPHTRTDLMKRHGTKKKLNSLRILLCRENISLPHKFTLLGVMHESCHVSYLFYELCNNSNNNDEVKDLDRRR